ncbi:hypothetical protein [Paracoccus jeotgali]|uniref:hypothetical protein n=1 Tax=Paracoccus jeotgali TaxID=2065379 RepID=UPI0018640477|nr:hypothetical protein [Paracoccus jeotgali]
MLTNDLAAKREILTGLGVAADRILTGYGFTGTTRAGSGLDQALAALRDGHSPVVLTLCRQARAVPIRAPLPKTRLRVESSFRPVQPLKVRLIRRASFLQEEQSVLTIT